MKKHYFFQIGLVGILLFFQSCSKESPAHMGTSQPTNPEWVNVINIKLSPNQLYQLAIDKSSTVSIAKQASYYKISQTAADTKSSATIYSYMPATDYSGDDEIMLNISNSESSSTRGCGNGRGSFSSNSNTLIKVKVGN